MVSSLLDFRYSSLMRDESFLETYTFENAKFAVPVGLVLIIVSVDS